MVAGALKKKTCSEKRGRGEEETHRIGVIQSRFLVHIIDVNVRQSERPFEIELAKLREKVDDPIRNEKTQEIVHGSARIWRRCQCAYRLVAARGAHGGPR